MRKLFFLFFICNFFFHATIFAQVNDSLAGIEVFARITNAMQNFKPDTSEVPQDKITRKIIELRNLRGGFNINEAIGFKLEEDFKKEDISQLQYDELHHYFFVGKGKRYLDNAIIWIYRRNFNYKELKQLTHFYKTSAGKKMSAQFPIVMMQSLVSGELIKSWIE